MLWGTSVYKTAATLYLLFFLFSTTEIAAQKTDSTSAWIKVIAELEQYYVVVDDDINHPHLINRGDSVKVDPGMRHITVVWKTINDHKLPIYAKAGETVNRRFYHTFPAYPRSSYQTIVNQANLFITTDKNSTVYINGERVGKHLVRTLLNPGTHQLRIEHPEYGTLKKRVEVNSMNMTKVARFNENPSKLSFAAKLLPGAEYIASKRYISATITYMGLGLLTNSLIRTNNKYDEKYDEFDKWELRYRTSDDPSAVIRFRENALQAEEELQKITRQFNLTFIALCTGYLLSTYNAFRKPRSGYRGNSFLKNSDMSFSPNSINNRTFSVLTYRYTFN